MVCCINVSMAGEVCWQHLIGEGGRFKVRGVEFVSILLS